MRELCASAAKLMMKDRKSHHSLVYTEDGGSSPRSSAEDFDFGDSYPGGTFAGGVGRAGILQTTQRAKSTSARHWQARESSVGGSCKSIDRSSMIRIPETD